MQVCISLQTDNHASTPLLSLLKTGLASETVSKFFFFKIQKHDFLRFLSCCARFLKHCTGILCQYEVVLTETSRHDTVGQTQCDDNYTRDEL